MDRTRRSKKQDGFIRLVGGAIQECNNIARYYMDIIFQRCDSSVS